MIDINLVHNQIPNEIDIPRSKNNYKRLLLISLFSLFSLMLLLVVFYSFTAHYLKNKVNSIKTTSTERISKKHKPLHKTQKKLKIEVANSKKMHVKAPKTNQPNKQRLISNKPIFSFNVALSDTAAKPVKKREHTMPVLMSKRINKQQKDNRTTKATKKLYNVIIITKHHTQTNRLKTLLNARNISSKTVKKAYMTKTFYDVYVGGLDSYNETMKFKKALIKKGYHIYSIKNINLLYYINIAEHINKSLKNKYMALWSNTGFKIVAYKYTKKFYRYNTVCKLDKNFINSLKKQGYFIKIKK